MDQQDDKNYQANDGRQMALIDHITRTRVFNNKYWKEECFGLTAVTLVDKAIKLDSIGGNYSGTAKPTHFMCLLLKLLQMNPEKDIIYEFIKNKDYKYVNALALFYLRMTGKPREIYIMMEIFYSDFRKLRVRHLDGSYGLMYMDDFAHQLATEESMFSIALPRIPKRWLLEDQGILEPRKSAIEDELVDDDQSPPLPDDDEPPIPDDDEPPMVRSRSRSQDKQHQHKQ